MRIGIIGSGFGAAVHLPAFRRLPGVRVVAIAGQRVDKAQALARVNGIELGASIEAVLESPVDAVSIALPPALGASIADGALEKGLAVFAEKPLAESAARAVALAGKARGRTATVDFELPELDSFRELKRRIAGERVQAIRMTWRTSSYGHMHKRWSWKLDQARHGGVMNLLGSHALYLVEWLLGPMAELQASLSSDRTRAIAPANARPAEDRAVLRARSQYGVPVDIEVDNASGGDGLRCEVRLDGGALTITETGTPGAFALTDAGSRTIAADEPARGADWRIEPVCRLAARFVAAASSGAGCRPDFNDGVRVQRLLDAAKRSSATGRSVDVTEAA